MQAIELKLREIQRFVHQEKQAVDKARVLISACSKQRDQLHYLSTHLPTRLPEAVTVRPKLPQQTAGAQAPAKETSGDEVSESDENLDTANVEPQPTRPAANDKKKRPKAPRRCRIFLQCFGSWAAFMCKPTAGQVMYYIQALVLNILEATMSNGIPVLQTFL